MPDTGPTIVPTSEQLRGITHPVRLRLLGLLRMDGPQTSADLARATGLNTGATSYHLRQLAQHGFIEDAPGLGSGRERHWRAKYSRTETAGAPTAPGASASVDDHAAWQQTIITWTAGQLQAAQDEWTDLPDHWRAATTFNDWLLRLTAEQATEVVRRLRAAVEEVSEEFPADPPDQVERSGAHGTELWEVHLLAFPVPSRIPHREDDA